MNTYATLVDLRKYFRAETGQSLNAAQGVNTEEAIDYFISRTQDILWMEKDWPSKEVRRFVTATAGSRVIAYPVDLPFAMINKVSAQKSPGVDSWVPLKFRIRTRDFTATDPLTGAQGWPPQRWDHSTDDEPYLGEMQLWPLPSATGGLMLEGQKVLLPLDEDTDQCELPAQLIIMRAAAEISARHGLKDGQIKIQAAQNLADTLLAQMRGDKHDDIIIGGGEDPNMCGFRPDRYGEGNY